MSMTYDEIFTVFGLKSKIDKTISYAFMPIFQMTIQEAPALIILTDYLERTIKSKTRYLWTDAFSILALCREGRRDLAVRLANETIDVLGKTVNRVPLSSSEKPTANGLRIGKPRLQREVNEPYDESDEWDRDGQYFHYCTKFAWALEELSNTAPNEQEKVKYKNLAVEMMRGVCTKFINPIGSNSTRFKIYWKMDVELTRPLVPSQGQHDPIDGYITCKSLGITDKFVEHLYQMTLSRSLVSSDLLGIGGLLMDCARVRELDLGLFARLKDSITRSIGFFMRFQADKLLILSSSQRLCFREMGLVIGAAMSRNKGITFTNLDSITDAIHKFWNEPSNRNNSLYKEHENINEVMRAFALSLLNEQQ